MKISSAQSTDSMQSAMFHSSLKVVMITVDIDHNPSQSHVAFGDLEGCFRLQQESSDYLVCPHTDDRPVRPRHPDIRDVAGPPGQNPLVCGLDMGVGTHDHRYPAVEMDPQRLLLARCFGMEVDKHDLDLGSQRLEQTIRNPEG